MRCLWLTWTDPTPEHDGQRVYSGRLLDAFSDAGASIDVLCAASDQSQRKSGQLDGSTRWWLVSPDSRPGWTSLFANLPHVAHRSNTGQMRTMYRTLLDRENWDCVVFDGLYTGWALDTFKRAFRRQMTRPKLVYISHNHEESTRAGIALRYRGNPLKRAALMIDADKVGRLERAMVRAADLVTAITPEDAALFSIYAPGKPIHVLTPGYQGRRLAQRQITPATPRRAVMVGSFEWIAKQTNLKEFLTVADPLFAAADTELQVVGNGDPNFFDHLQRDLSATRLIGKVENVDPYLWNSRLAINAERLGGGFKLKILDYVFNRVPIAALEGSIAGVPLQSDHSILTYPDYDQLAHGVVQVIDDIALLNRMQQRAYAQCRRGFDWTRRGRNLIEAIGSL